MCRKILKKEEIRRNVTNAKNVEINREQLNNKADLNVKDFV